MIRSLPFDHYRILITGSRHWDDEQAITDALLDVARDQDRPLTVVHGGASGADNIAGVVAEELGMNVEVHPADWDKHGKAAGPIRNQKMVELGADVCLAFPLADSRGTKHCMMVASRAGIPVRVVRETNR